LSTTSSDTALVPQDRVWLALRFGWTVAEVYGRLADNPPPDMPSSSTRLFLSDLSPSPNERLWAATRRLIYLARQLFPAEKGRECNDNESTSEEPKPWLAEYPACIDDLLQRLEKRMPGRGKLLKSKAVYDDLNRWSRQIWAALDAEDPLLAEAATLGASLADTFWGWCFPTYGQPASDADEVWQDVLNPRRMNDMIRQVWQIETRLPAHVGPLLRHSLWEWGIADQLTRSSSGELEIISPFLYNLRSLRWAQLRRRPRVKACQKNPLQLSTWEKKELWEYLEKQMDIWEHLVFNRPVDYLLLPSDWRHIRWVTAILYAGAIVLILISGALLLALSIGLVGRILGYLLPRLAQPTEFKDQLSLVSTLAVVLGFLATQIWRGGSWLQHRYDAIGGWVTIRKLQQRSLYTWNGQLKPLRWIWLQRLLRAKD
jgi:hypothetical protein